MFDQKALQQINERGAKWAIRKNQSVGMTLELDREGCPWPTDWSGFKRLSFDAKRADDVPSTVALKLRSFHPTRGVKYVSRSIALTRSGAEHYIDLTRVADLVDLTHMTHVTWFTWRPEFDRTFWMGNLRLE